MECVIYSGHICDLWHYVVDGMWQLFWAVGTCFIVFVSIFIMPTLGWRYLLGIAAVPLIVFFAACFVSVLLLFVIL